MTASPKRRKNRFSTTLALLTCILILPGYMFVEVPATGGEGKPLRWPDSFPYVEYDLNPEFTTLSASAEEIAAGVTEASDVWFLQGDSRFAIGQKEATGEVAPFVPSVINCTEGIKGELKLKRGSVAADNSANADCTGIACSFIWSCENEILHFDVRLNEFDNSFTLAGENSFVPVLSHEFGHVAGLDHCVVGEKGCSPESPFSRPDGIMNRFYAETAELSEDDITGIQALYGVYQSKFPKTGDYKLSGDEIQSISTLLTMQNEEGYDTPEARQEQAQAAQETFQFVNSGEIDRTLDWVPVRGYEKGMSAIQYFNKMNDMIKSNLSSLNDLQLEYMKRNLSAGSAVMDDMLQKYNPGDRAPSRNTFEYIDNGNLDLRKAMINEQKRRGLL